MELDLQSLVEGIRRRRRPIAPLLLGLQLLPQRNGDQEPADELSAAVLAAADELPLLSFLLRQPSHGGPLVELQSIGLVAAFEEPLSQGVYDVEGLRLRLQ